MVKYIILQGGFLPAFWLMSTELYPDDNTVFYDNPFVIDYVKVYQKRK